MWSFVVLFLSCVCACDLFLFSMNSFPSLRRHLSIIVIIVVDEWQLVAL